MRPDHITLTEGDDVAIALADLPAGHVLGAVALTTPVPRGHKVALRDLPVGTQVHRYGQIIGRVTRAIAAGEHVHVQNLGMSDHSSDHAIGESLRDVEKTEAPRSFMGYRRAVGRSGTRNFLGVLTSVNCSGSVARFIAEAAEQTDWFRALKNVDGIVPIAHGSGCGMSGDNEGYLTLFRTLQGYARNPNFAGILWWALAARSCRSRLWSARRGCGRMAGSRI